MNHWLERLTFWRQLALGLLLQLVGFTLADLLGQDILRVGGCVLFGLLFVLHPVSPRGMRLGNAETLMRLAGAIVIFQGLSEYLR